MSEVLPNASSMRHASSDEAMAPVESVTNAIVRITPQREEESKAAHGIPEPQSMRRPNGQWVKGVSGNPGGQKQGIRDVRLLARRHTEEAISALAEIVKGRGDARARVAAACALLDRGWGKAIAHLEVERVSPAPANAWDLSRLSLDELRQLGALREKARVPSPEDEEETP